MRRILYFLIFVFLLLFYSNVLAVETGLYYHSDGRYVDVSSTDVKIYTSTGVLLRTTNFPTGAIADSKSLQVNVAISGVGPEAMYLTSSNFIRYKNNGSWLDLTAGFGNIYYYLSGGLFDIYCYNTSSNYCYGLNNGGMTSDSTPPATILYVASGQVIFGYEILTFGVPQICTIENIPDFQNIDIQPTSTGAISEYIENPTENIYAYSTSLSGENPLQVIALGIEGENGFDDFSHKSGSFTFNTENSTNFSQRKTFISISAKNGVQYIKMLGNYGSVDIVLYREDNKTIKQRIEDIDLNAWSEGFGYPTAGNLGQILIVFKNSFFEKTIDSLEVYSIGSENTKEVEICFDETEDKYFIDGEEWGGLESPYTTLVGDPTPTETTLQNNGYTFFENGFCLKDFTPFPSGGDLFFQIQNPAGELKTTYNISSSGLYRYGQNTCSIITTNYHTVEGKYYVKGLYKYNGITYEVNNDFTAYNIISPQYIANNSDFWSDEDTACGVSKDDTGFFPGVSRFFACLTQTMGNFFSNQYQAVKGIGGFIYKMSDIFTTEVKDFSFISGVYASAPLSDFMNFSETENFNNSIFGKIKSLLWGVIAVMIVTVSVGVIIYIKHD